MGPWESVAAAQARSTWRRAVAGPMPWPQVPRSSLGTLPLGVVRPLLGRVVLGTTHGPVRGREGFQVTRQEPREPVNLA